MMSRGRASARYVRTGSRWQSQNATRPTTAEDRLLAAIEVNGLPVVA